MNLTTQDARLLLALLGEGVSAIRPGQYTAQQAIVLKNALRAFASRDENKST